MGVSWAVAGEWLEPVSVGSLLGSVVLWRLSTWPFSYFMLANLRPQALKGHSSPVDAPSANSSGALEAESSLNPLYDCRMTSSAFLDLKKVLPCDSRIFFFSSIFAMALARL